MQKIGQSGGFLGPLLNPGLSLMKDVLEASGKSVLFSLGLTTAASATDDAIQKTFLNQVDNINNFKQRNKWYHENT